MVYELTAERRREYRDTSIRSRLRKQQLLSAGQSVRIDVDPRFKPETLMPAVRKSGLTCLSLFAGGGGLDLGFDYAGYALAGTYEILDVCGQTLENNRPHWPVFHGDAGDVTKIDWRTYRGVDVVHGGPPCQPFSVAGKQTGAVDPRNMWPSFVACIQEVKPKAFVAENVPGLLGRKFARFVDEDIVSPLKNAYVVFAFTLDASDFGVPQARRRVFFVGFRSAIHARRFARPIGVYADRTLFQKDNLARNTARWALGLPDIGFDAVAPTIRSGFTGPRKTTGVVNSKASLRVWDKLQIWPHGVQPNRELAALYTPENAHFRLAIDDCALLQGFPENWKFAGAVYQALGQIGNSVAPPVAYSIANSVTRALGARNASTG